MATRAYCMPKAKGGAIGGGVDCAWKTCAKPRTPLQRSAFIDLCTQWLVAQDSSPVAYAPPPSTAPETQQLGQQLGQLFPRTSYIASYKRTHATATESHHPMGCTPREFRLQGSPSIRHCNICGKEDKNQHIQPVMANPFTPCLLVMVCTACRC